MITVSNPPSTVSVPVATTAEEGKTKVDNNMTGDPIAITTHSIGIPSGVAELDAGGLVPVAELPLDVAYIDVGNTFTETQTIDDGSGNIIDLAPDQIDVFDGVGGSSDIFPGYMYMDSDSFSAVHLSTSTGVLMLIDSPLGADLINGGRVSFNTYQYENLGTPPTNIHQDVDGSIHLQVAPAGTRYTPITWTDALIINNDSSVTIDYGDVTLGMGNRIIVTDGSTTWAYHQSDQVLVQDVSSNSTDIKPDRLEVFGPGAQTVMMAGSGSMFNVDPVWLNISTTDTGINGVLGVTGTGYDVAQNATLFATNVYHYTHDGATSNVHQDQDGTIHLQVAASGAALSPITWVDALIINNDGTIDLASTPTTTTAPAAGMADALPVLPTGYATIDIGGTPRQIAYY